MSSREEILNNIRSNVRPTLPKPIINIETIDTKDKVEAFKAALESVAAQFVELKKDENMGQVLKKLYPEAKRIASSIKGIDGIDIDLETVENPRILNGIDIGIVKGCFGVIENGAIWITQDVRHKAIYFIPERLVIILDHTQIVNNMHEAYLRPEPNGDFEYGCFIAGPSKTADIEQALVIGAHGARAVTVVLI